MRVFFNPLGFHISRYSTARQNVELGWPTPSKPGYFVCFEKRKISPSPCNVISYSRVKQFLFQLLFKFCFQKLEFIFLESCMLLLMLRYNFPKHFRWSNFYIIITNDSQSLSRHRNGQNNFFLSSSGSPHAKWLGLKSLMVFGVVFLGTVYYYERLLYHL